MIGRKNMDITYVTGNSYKVELAKRILGPHGVNVLQKKIHCPEIQDDDITNVSKYSAKYAANELNMPVIKNDSGLIVEALKGFPGPYTSYIEDTITEVGLLKLMQSETNRKACFIEVISYCEPGKEPVSFVSYTTGTIATELRGTYGWSFDKLFIPEGKTKTLAEFEDDERWKFWSDDAYLQLEKYLKSLK